MRESLRSSQPIEFAGSGREEKSAWVGQVLATQNCAVLSKPERGIVRAYVENVTGLSVSQTTRLIRSFVDYGAVLLALYQRHRLQVRYTPVDVALLAEWIGRTSG